MLWLCLRFPLLPLEVFMQEPRLGNNQQPAALVERQRIVLGNSSAIGAGIKPGISLTTAQALCSTAHIFIRNRQKEADALQTLAYSCYRFTPVIILSPPDSLLLEIGACLKLFEGLPRLLALINKTLMEQGYQHVIGLAPTPKAAILISHPVGDQSRHEPAKFFNPEHGGLSDAQAFKQYLYTLPLSSISFEYCSLALKKKFQLTGFKCLGDLLKLPGGALGKRYGKDFLLYLKQLTGDLPDPQLSLQLPPYFDHHLDFENTINTTEMLAFPMKRLLSTLCDYLYARQLHCNKISWHMTLIDSSTVPLEIHFSRPQNNLEHFLSLSRLQLENRTFSAPVSSLRLQVHDLYLAEQHNTDLFDRQNDGHKHQDLMAALDKLRTRLGSDAVYSLALADSHIPEQAWQFTAVNKASDTPQNITHNDDTQHLHQAGNRPLWLLDKPAAVQKKSRHLYWRGALELLQGPERIEGNWWQQAVCRDYFIARHDSGVLYWIYQDRLSDSWFVHGTFG